MHNDINPRNIILQEDLQPQVIDLGYSGSTSDEASIKPIAHLCYTAPEWLFADEPRGDLMAKETWATAMTLIELWGYNGIFQFERPRLNVSDPHLLADWLRFMQNAFYESLNQPEYGLLTIADIPESCKQAIRSILEAMLAKDPGERLSIAQALDSFKTIQIQNDCCLSPRLS